jgi:DNA-binding NtrC family response regulator
MDVLLADDDSDDCLLFKDALSEFPISTHLMVVNDGEQLMNLLVGIFKIPEVLFLDLNMPRKNGFECLSEMKTMQRLQQMPIVIFSTSFDIDIVKKLYNEGAHYYIRKPNEFRKFTEIVHYAISSVNQAQLLKPTLENFILYS